MNKTRLFGLVAIIVALVTFTGCDDILEAFYPEFGEKFSGDGNSVGIYVEVEVPGSDIVNPQIAVVVERLDNSREWVQQAFVWPFWNWNSAGNVILSAYVDLYGIPDGEYKVIVWLERTETGNGYPDFDEPSRDAVWFRDGDPDMKENVFVLGDGMNRIEGEAILRIFEGAAVNRDFELMGQRVLNINELSITYSQGNVKTYNIAPRDEAAGAVTDVSYTLWGPSGDMARGSVGVPPQTTPQFAIDYTGFPSGYYWLDVTIRYADDWYEYKGFPMKVLENELGSSAYYDAIITLWGMNEPPFGFTQTTEVYWETKIHDADGYSWTNWDWTHPTAEGAIGIELASLAYDPSGYYDSGDGVDFLEVAIDMNGDDMIGDGDFYAEYPLGISSFDLVDGDYYIDFWSGDFRRIFAPPAPAY